MNKYILYFLLLAAVFTACTTDDYRQISYSKFLKNHPYSIGQTSVDLTDSTRNRPVKLEIWYPTQDTTAENRSALYPFKLPPTSFGAAIQQGQLPLIMLSHGTGGNRISLMWLASELVGNGYIVAAVDHYGNTSDNKIPKNFVEIWDRPLDISFALDYLMHHQSWKQSIDTTRIGMAGFSLGGYTTIALAGGVIDYQLIKEFSKTPEGQSEFDLPELGDVSALITPELIATGNSPKFSNLKDQRFAAFVAMAPAIGQGFNNTSQVESVTAPLLIIGAESDDRTPVNSNAQHYHQLIENSQYMELEGETSHYVFLNEATDDLKKHAPVPFQDAPSVDREAIHQQVAKLVLEFFNQNL